jgi:ribosome-associated toxin RatA of RatAB toxin-antitoxin module
MSGVSQKIVVDVSPDEFFDVIIDYESYPNFLSDLQEAEILEKKSNEAVGKFKLKLIKTVEYTLKMKEDRPKSMSWDLVQSNVMKANKGAWRLKPVDGGKKTEAEYSIDVRFGLFVPKMITNQLTKVNLPATLKAFKGEAERRKAEG